MCVGFLALGVQGLFGGLLFFRFRRGGAFIIAVVIGFFRAGQHAVGDDARVLTQLLLDRGGDLGILFQELAGILAALADALAVEGEPGAGLLDHAGIDAEVDDLAFF